MINHKEHSFLINSSKFFNELDSYYRAIDSVAILAITDVEGTIIKVNDNFCNISGYSEDELIGKNHRIIKSGYHSHKFFENLHKKIANGDIWRGELKNKRKDGTLYWVDTVITPIYGDDNKPINYLSLRFDITKRKDSEYKFQEYVKRCGEDRLIKQSEFKNKMIYALSHDIKGPLRSLDGILQLFELGGLTTNEMTLRIKDIRNEINNTDKYIEDLISLAEDHYISRNTLTKINLKEAIKEIINSSGEKFIKKKVYFKTRLNHTCKVYSHLELITIIVRNFISNAIKFSHPEGEIIIESFSDKYVTTIKVIDFGVGMDKDYLNKIKSKIKVSTKGTMGEQGSGIGMFICRELIHDIGGDFFVESERDKGSIFSFSFPHTKQKTLS